MKDSISLREKARQYEENLSGEALRIFREVYRSQMRSSSVQKAFVAAKKAVEDKVSKV